MGFKPSEVTDVGRGGKREAFYTLTEDALENLIMVNTAWQCSHSCYFDSVASACRRAP